MMNEVGMMTNITAPGHGHPVTSDVRLMLEIVLLPSACALAKCAGKLSLFFCYGKLSESTPEMARFVIPFRARIWTP